MWKFAIKSYFQKNNLINEKENEIISNKKEYFYSFIRELFNYHRQSREVLFYANRINISSNYLNEVCQSVCEHSAKEIIDGCDIDIEREVMRNRKAGEKYPGYAPRSWENRTWC